MMMMMKIYTRTGDDGSTALFGGKRVHKANPRVNAYGSVDEFNATLGLARAAISSVNDDQTISFTDLDAILNTLQNLAFRIGADLASPSRDPDDSTDSSSPQSSITRSDITSIEKWIDEHEKSLPELRSFILPGGTELAARLHHARTVCRRSEREVAYLCQLEENRISADRDALILLNRISDLLFVLARVANARQSVPDVPWRPPSQNEAD